MSGPKWSRGYGQSHCHSHTILLPPPSTAGFPSVLEMAGSGGKPLAQLQFMVMVAIWPLVAHRHQCSVRFGMPIYFQQLTHISFDTPPFLHKAKVPKSSCFCSCKTIKLHCRVTTNEMHQIQGFKNTELIILSVLMHSQHSKFEVTGGCFFPLEILWTNIRVRGWKRLNLWWPMQSFFPWLGGGMWKCVWHSLQKG